MKASAPAAGPHNLPSIAALKHYCISGAVRCLRSCWQLAGWPQGCQGADIWRLGGGFGCLWAAFGCRGAAYAAYCRKRCIWCCLVGQRVAYGLIWDICGGAFGCRWVAFGCTGAAYAAYGSIRCIWLLAGLPQGPTDLRQHAHWTVKWSSRGPNSKHNYCKQQAAIL